MKKFIKKIFITAFYIFFLPIHIFSNDTLIQHISGGNEWTYGKTNYITIEQEDLTIDLYDSYYHITVDYIFRNNGETTECEVGFPETQFENTTEDSSDTIRNFKTTVNGKQENTFLRPADILIGKSLHQKISKFYTKNVIFSGNDTTKIHIEYDVSYSKNTYGHGSFLADYYLGSAVCWNKLEKLNLQINIHYEHYYIDEINFDHLIDNNKPNNIEILKYKNSRSCKLEFSNINLTLDTQVKIYLHNDDYDVFGLPWDYNFEYYVYPEYCFHLLTKEQLRKARNLIYAWHGYIFKSKDLRIFFEKWNNWYKPNENFSEEMFNEKELQNLKILKQIEASK